MIDDNLKEGQISRVQVAAGWIDAVIVKID
jgi:hypothetical protein